MHRAGYMVNYSGVGVVGVGGGGIYREKENRPGGLN